MHHHPDHRGGTRIGEIVLYDITVSGDPIDIWVKIQRMRRAVNVRKTVGWKPFQSDETWLYFANHDARLCPICKQFAARKSYNGTNIPVDFPLNEKFIGIRKRLPKVHRHKPWLKGICRCNIEWVDPVGTLEKRFGEELESLNF